MKLLDNDLEENEIIVLFESFDNSRDGNINYDEFIRAVKGPMNQFRRSLIEKVFKKLDRDNSGKIDINDLKNYYNTSQHPDVKSGKKTEEEVLDEFLETFDTHHNVISNNHKSRSIDFLELLE